MIQAKMNTDFRGQVFQDFGKVILTDGQTFVVRTESGDFTAKRAAGCLLTPGLGDLVLLADGGSRGSFILSVLERPKGASSLIQVQGDLELKVEGGRLDLGADTGIDLTTPRDLTIRASGLDAALVRAEVKVPSCSFWGNLAQVRVDKITVLASSLDATVKRVFQRLKQSFRMVEDSEVVRAGRVDVKAEKDMSLRGQNALVTAEDLVKVDAGQIHLG